MKKKKSTILDKKDIIVICICLAGIFFCLFGYFADVYRVNRRNDIQPVAELTSKVKSVQRRFRDRLVWDMLRPSSPLYTGDFVRTASYSEAVITFNSGAVLNMSQDSLIEILPEEETMRLKITSGNVSLKAAEKITLTAGNEVLEVEKGSVVSMNVEAVAPTIKVISKNKQIDATTATVKKISLSVQEGSVRQSKIDGSIVLVNAGSQLVMGADGLPSKDPAIIMLSPLPVQKIAKKSDENAQIEFVWKNYNYSKDTKTKIELAYDKNFVYPYESRLVSDAESTVFDLPTRVIYWRASPADADGNPLDTHTTSGTISVQTTMPIRKLQPLQNITYTLKSSKATLRFSWTQDELAEGYELTVADNPEMSNPLVLHKTQDTYANLSGFEEGLWYWQVKPCYSDTMLYMLDETEPACFAVKGGVSLKAVKLLKPAAEDVIYTANGRQPVIFSWSAGTDAKTYTLTIADNPKLANPIFTTETEQNYYSITPGKTGLSDDKKWYWGISYKDSDGKDSPASEVSSLYTLGKAPYYKVTSPAPDSSFTQTQFLSTLFSADTNIPLPNRLQIATDPQFTQIVADETIQGTSFRVNTKPDSGFYYWRMSSGSFTSSVYTLYIMPDKKQDSVQIPMVSVAGGSFLMGNNNGTNTEKPAHTVSVNGFSISRTEITQEQFENVMGSNPSYSRNPAMPVEQVTWFEAVEFCNRLSMMEGLTPAYSINGKNITWNTQANGYRLPTEAEWEFAAGSGTGDGKQKVSAEGCVWNSTNSAGQSHECGTLEANAANLFDMCGNVSEWCWDYYGVYRTGEQTNPKGTESGTQRIIRGGCWNSNPQQCTATFRDCQKPEIRSSYTGFRICRGSF